MRCLRYLLPPLTLIAFVTSLLGVLPQFPLFTNTLDKYGQTGGTLKVNFFVMTASSFTLDNFVADARNDTRVNYLYCSEYKTAMRATLAFGLAACVLSFFAFFLSILQSCCKRKMKLVLLVYVGLGFVCELICVITLVLYYPRKFCANNINDTLPNVFNTTMISMKSMGYVIGIGVYMHVIAVIALFLSLIVTPFTQDLWCGRC